jgi:hypothetical protein
MKSKTSETSPAKSLCGELNTLEKAFHQILRAYSLRFDADLNQVRQAVKALEEGKKIPQTRIHDLRDMLMLIRKLDVKPLKGRRRDLKRAESVVEDLGRFIKDWEATSEKASRANPLK